MTGKHIAMDSTETLPVPLLPAPHEDKFEKELQAFHRLLPELLRTHRDQYVAIYEGQVVDSGPDQIEVAKRAYARFGYIPILVTLVTDRPRVIRIPSPRVRRDWKWDDPIQISRQVDPAAPFVHVTLRRPENGKVVANLPVQLDIAVDRTVIPATLVDLLGMSPVDELQVAGLGGRVFSAPAYLVELMLPTLSPHEVVVIAHEAEPFILLGRDVLNRHRLLLDGPGLVLEID